MCAKTYEVKRHVITVIAMMVLGGNLREDPIDGLARESMAIIPQQILAIQQEIMIHVEFPKLAIQDVKMLVTKELAHLVDVVVFI